jgi:hypothetical protein
MILISGANGMLGSANGKVSLTELIQYMDFKG